MHNLAARDVPIAKQPHHPHNGICQYGRRGPEDARKTFPFEHVQKSLGTGDQRKARAEALTLDPIRLDHIWEARFAEARRRKGLRVGADRPA